jgi:motility quorum-sensing regulator / GCU-specific mRNA interferase toxin
MLKLKPHHDLAGIQALFSSVKTLRITVVALRSADAIGFTPDDIVEVVQELARQDFVKSETAHSPRNSKVWHDSYAIRYLGLWLYLKFAGETLIDIKLTSFKERL